MKQKTLLLTIILFLISNIYGFSITKNPNEELVNVSETVELALIIASLSDLDRNSNNSIDRTSDYFNAVEKHFEPIKTHEIFTILTSNFNLPRLVGNAADYGFDDNGKLVRVDNSGSIWGDDDGNLFANNLELIQDFAEKGEFLTFFDKHKSLYTEIVATTENSIQKDKMSNWLNKNYSITPKPFKVFVSPLMSGFHWTTLNKPEQRIWVNAPSKVTEWTEFKRVVYSRTIFTELDHGYVNPITSKHSKKVNKAYRDLEYWGTKNGAKGYDSPELKFNEYMTWALYLMYASDFLLDNEYEKLEGQIISFMSKNRGFIQFEQFTKVALEKYKKSNTTAEEVQLAMIDWALKL